VKVMACTPEVSLWPDSSTSPSNYGWLFTLFPRVIYGIYCFFFPPRSS
jgi:hypothetical protein